jgi:hypothetical protein
MEEQSHGRRGRITPKNRADRGGLSNIEIAEALTLSVRTIEGHIYRACTRVGAATRTELAQLITQFAPPHLLRHH